MKQIMTLALVSFSFLCFSYAGYSHKNHNSKEIPLTTEGQMWLEENGGEAPNNIITREEANKEDRQKTQLAHGSPFECHYVITGYYHPYDVVEQTVCGDYACFFDLIKIPCQHAIFECW